MNAPTPAERTLAEPPPRRVRNALLRSMVVGAMLTGVLFAWFIWLDAVHAPGPEPIYDPAYFVPTYGPIAVVVALVYLVPLPLAVWLRRHVGPPKWLVRLDRLFNLCDGQSQATARDRAVAEVSAECALAAMFASVTVPTVLLAASLGRMSAAEWLMTLIGLVMVAPIVFGFAALWYLAIECWFLRRARRSDRPAT